MTCTEFLRKALKTAFTLIGVSILLFTVSFSQPISQPLKYEGYSSPVYDGFRRQSQYVTMTDGTRLAVDVLFPDKRTQGSSPESYPVIFQYTPYNRAYILPKMGPAKHLATSIIGMGWGPEFNQTNLFPTLKSFLAHGYVLVVADMRGTGASFGSQMPLMPQLGKDGKEIIDWIAGQAWCDGNVGMMGMSYLGWSQFATAGQQPAALKCIMPEVMAFDAYTGLNRPGGISATRWLKGFSDFLRNLNRNILDLKERALPALPVVDEDQDGKLIDERPFIDSLILAKDAEVVYGDKVARTENLYYKATRQHLENILVEDLMAPEMAYFDSKGPGVYEKISFMDGSAGSYTSSLMESGIPIYHVGGWFDGFTRGTTKLYATMKETNPSKLIIAPRFHYNVIIGAYKRYLNYKGNYEKQLAVEQLRFFDRYLKGIENGIDKESAVNLYVMHKGWRAEPDWPLERQELTPYYLQTNHTMTPQAPLEGEDIYEVNYEVSSNYGPKDRNRWIMYENGTGKIMDRTAIDSKCLTYETFPFPEDTEVTGHPIVHLWLSSNQADGDVFVYLSDVDETGKSIYVTEGQLRAGWARLFPDDEQIDSKVDVKPDLPWHGFKKDQYQSAPFADGKTIELTFDMLPTSWVFKKGHKLRISIAGADNGNFEFNPYICPENKLENCPTTMWEVHRGEATPSRIILPIIPND